MVVVAVVREDALFQVSEQRMSLRLALTARKVIVLFHCSNSLVKKSSYVRVGLSHYPLVALSYYPP